MLNQEVLVLNSGFIPIRISTVRESICLLFEEKAYPVVEEDKYIHSPNLVMRVPSVIALIKYHDFPKRRVHFSRLNVIYRDDQKCMYCGKQFSIKHLTVDHVIPRSRWTGDGKVTQWQNVVASCKECNHRKGNRLLSELGWKLVKAPAEPEYMPYFVISRSKAEKKGWLNFCEVNVRLVEML